MSFWRIFGILMTFIAIVAIDVIAIYQLYTLKAFVGVMSMVIVSIFAVGLLAKVLHLESNDR